MEAHILMAEHKKLPATTRYTVVHSDYNVERQGMAQLLFLVLLFKAERKREFSHTKLYTNISVYNEVSVST